jgi:acetyl/propionyl-CoA carboxylase alpha subunit
MKDMMPNGSVVPAPAQVLTGPIGKLLIANRGEIASRIMRTAHALGLATVAVYSDPDAGAEYVTLADEAVRLPGAAPADTYLRGAAIIAAALATGADAVHPGYGFLSENAAFARACEQAGLIFVGPAPDTIAAMGSKIEAKAIMAAAGVPVLPGVSVPAALNAPNTPNAPNDDPAPDYPAGLAAEAARTGFPLLVKAAFGGGGRGMRLVRDPDELAGAVQAARREAASAFGDGTVFLERFVEDPRHVEVQILGDAHGTVVPLFERECSIQRRYQKIVEEAPSPGVDDELRAALTAAAVAAGQAIGYVGAGTVEFVLDASGSFYFLEVNTRLQVEHPVTEEVTGLDLVELQLRIAAGEPLPPEATNAQISGHAIEVRLYAEDVPAGFLPVTGMLHRFAIPAPAGVRVDTGFRDGSVVSPHYDAMLAKVIAHGRTRAEAARRLARALERAEIHGVTTNRDLLAAILREPEFLAGRTDTGYLTRHDPAALSAAARSAAPGATALHALVAALARPAVHRAEAPVLATLPSGWRNVRSAAQRVTYRVGHDELAVAYRVTGATAETSTVEASTVEASTVETSTVEASVNGVPLGGTLILHAAGQDRVDLEVDGLRRRYLVHRVQAQAYVDASNGSTALTEVPRFGQPDAMAPSGSLLAPMPGLVLRVLAEVGATVVAGQPLIVLEAMKMEQTVAAPADGTVAELHAKAGDQVSTGQVLAVVDAGGPEGKE